MLGRGWRRSKRAASRIAHSPGLQFDHLFLVDLNVSMDFDSGECIRCLECTRCGHVRVTAPFLSPKEVKVDG